MKKYLNLILAGALTITAFSCTKETEDLEHQTVPAGPVKITFNAGNVNTKTSLGESKAVLWSSGDVLSVFDDGLSNNKFDQSDLSADLASASFSGTATESDIYYAVYPYRVGNASTAAGVIDTYLSPDQFAVANSFGVGANLALGVSTDDGTSKYFSMQQVGAFVKFSFSGCSTVTSICLKAIGGEKISGGVTATCTAGVFSALTKNDGSSLDEVTLYPAAGNTYIAPGTYYAVLLPVTLSSGLQILFTEKTGDAEKIIAAKIPSSISLVKNTVTAIPSEIVLPDVSNPAWMAQETISVLFKERTHLMDNEGNTTWPFTSAGPTAYSSSSETTTDGYSIHINFAGKTPTQSANNGLNITSGTCTGWNFTLPAIAGKKLVKVEYYTSDNATGNPRITQAKKDNPPTTYATVYGAQNNTQEKHAKFVWDLPSMSAGVTYWINWYGDENRAANPGGSIGLNGFRAIYRDAEGPSKAVISASTDSYGAFIDQEVVLNGSFVAYDGTAAGYTYGFEYKAAGSSAISYAPRHSSSGESFSEGGSYVLRSGQGGEWTSVDGTQLSGTSFTATLNSLTRGQAYTVRAWARVGSDGEKVYGDEEEIGLLSKVSSGAVWQFGEDEFFTVWQNCSNNSSDEYNYHWEDRLTDGSISSYKYGSNGLFYQTTATGIAFREKNYLKFGSNQSFSFISGESGTATLSMVCKSTSNTARNINVAVNGTNVDTFNSSVSDESPVTSHEFSVNDGDKVSITINNNANLKSIGFTCSAQEATFVAAVDASSKSDRNTVYNFTVTASADLSWSVAASAGTLSKSAGTGNDTFTLTVPVNYNWGSGVNYTVTVTTSDERIVAGNRSQAIALTQASPTKVLFGCQWGTAFHTAYGQSYTASTDFTYQHATVNSSYISLPSGYIRGNITFQFTAGEAGTGRLHFYAKVIANKTLTVYKNGVQQQQWKPDSNLEPAEGLQVDIEVVEGDVIKIATAGSGNHYLYCSDSKPITWSLAE